MFNDALVASLATAIERHETLPAFPDGLTLDDAYRIQSEVVSMLSPDGAAGIKAGVTSEPLQQFFKIDHALLGKLYGSGEVRSPIQLPPKASIECEIGIVINADGTPVSAGPAIEFVRVDFSLPEDANAPNLVACNVGADRYLRGPQGPWRDDWSSLSVTLTRDGERLMTARLTDSLGGPDRALAWMLKEAPVRGFELKDNLFLMTGTCGQVITGEPGLYRADYGDLGVVEFEVTA